MDVDIIVPTKKTTESANSLAYEFDITLYDAYSVALTKELRFEFVTADDNFCKATIIKKFNRILRLNV